MQWSPTLNLKIGLLNAENLFLLFDQAPPADFAKNSANMSEAQWQRLSTSVYDNKSLKKTLEIAAALKEINADIYMLCEVGGVESLESFNEIFLDSAYAVCLIPGNSDRNIDVGYLIRKSAPFYFDLYSNKNRPIHFLYPHERTSFTNGYPLKGGKFVHTSPPAPTSSENLPGTTPALTLTPDLLGLVPSHKFSRDVAELRLFTKDKDRPFLIFLLTHLKSRLDPDRIDPHGFERRHAELKTLLEIYGELRTQFPNVPIVVGGDFNGNAAMTQTDDEFKAIYQTDLQDVLEVAQVEPPDRATFYQVRNGGKADGRQIDFAFMCTNLKPFLKPGSAYIYRYKDELGMTRDTPTNLDAKLRMPSDHYPLVFEIVNLPL